MAAPLTGLDTVASLEKQFFLVMEAFSDLQKNYSDSFPAETPIQVITAYVRDHLTGAITGSFQLASTTTQASNGTITIDPVPNDFLV